MYSKCNKVLELIRIHLIVNISISKIVRYRKLIKNQKVKEPKSIEVNKVAKWKVENILNKRIVLLWLKTLRVELRGNLVLDNTRELDKELFCKLVYLI